jgi:hypothetical protein
MSELELRLLDLREAIAFPATPDLATAAERVAATRVRPARPRWRPLAIGFAVALVIAAGVLAFSPGARSAFLELFRLKGATISRVESLPQVEPVALDLGERVSRSEAERRVGFRIVGLADEEPDAIHVRGNRLVSLVYGPADKPRLLLSQHRAEVWDGFVKKAAGRGTTIEPLTVGGEPGFFVSGEEHFVMFLEDGLVRDEPTSLAGNTLLWNRGELLLRLEADIERDQALELAESVG